MVRLALVAPGFSSDDRDWCIPALAHLVRSLSNRHEVVVFALRYPHGRGVFRAFGATVHALGGAEARGLSRLVLLARGRRRLLAAGRDRPFDLVHGLWADEPGWLAVATARSLGVPAVVSLLGGELVRFPEIGYGAQLSRTSRHLVRRALGTATVLTVGSHSMARLAAGWVPAERVHLAPLGVDTELFKPGPGDPALLDGSPRLLHVGSLTAVKDQKTLLLAFARATDDLPECRLHLVGDGPLRAELEALAGELAISGRVRFHGALPHDRLPDYYRAADLCVLTSRFESQSMVALEAAACGRVTVGTPVGILPELVPPTAQVPVGDRGALAEALARLGRDPALVRELGQRCLAAVRGFYTLTAAAARLEALYAVARGTTCQASAS
jgi:glycosyltransferase involved in cell wall biosynthesis